MKKSKPAYVYESPDKGETVFRHEIGKPETKELVKVGDDELDILDDHYQDWLDSYEAQPQYTWTTDNDSILNDEAWNRDFQDEATWRDIKRKAVDHPALKEAMEQMIMIYNLSIEHDNKDDDDVPF